MAIAADDLPPQVRNQLARLQQLQQQAQVVMQQRVQVEMQIRELDKTLEELEKVAADAPIYRSTGALLMRAKDRDTVKAGLSEEKETAEVRLGSLKKQEQKSKEALTALQQEIQAAISTLSAAQGGRSAKKAE